MKRILLIGCGNIGSRHLQSLSNTPGFSIDVVEYNPSAVKKAKDIIGISNQSDVVWYDNLNSIREVPDLCIIATSSDGRKQIIQEMLCRGVRRFLLEKIIAQSEKSYQDILESFLKYNAKGWVNITRRYSSYYQGLRDWFYTDNERIRILVDCGDHGLACNGIHYLDLFMFLDNSSKLEYIEEPRGFEITKTKRSDYIDFTGDLLIRSEKGSLIRLNFTDDSDALPVMIIQNSKRRYIIEDNSLTAFSSLKEDNWLLKEDLRMTEFPHVSRLTAIIVNEILLEDKCKLPTLEESFEPHRILLSRMLKKYKGRYGEEMEEVPVT